MAVTKYTYSIANDTLNGKLKASNLSQEIAQSSIVIAKDNIIGFGDVLDIYMKAALSTAEETTLDAVVAAHDGIPTEPPTVEIVIQEENIKTGGHYQECGFVIDVASGDSTKTVDISFPIPISLLSATWQNKTEFEGDSIEFLIAPDTTTGAITANVAIDDDVISVSQTVIDNTAIGYFMELNDGTNTNDLGRVKAIDTINKTITIENKATQAFTAATPTYVKQTVKMLPKSQLDTVGPMAAGESKIGGSHIPAGTLMRAVYFNDAGTAKKMRFFLEYLY